MKKQLVLFLALALCLGLTACGDTESDDTQSGYETVMDMEFHYIHSSCLAYNNFYMLIIKGILVIVYHTNFIYFILKISAYPYKLLY